MIIKILSICVVSLFILFDYHHKLLSNNNLLEATKITSSSQDKLVKNNVKLIYISNDLDCNQ